MICYPYKVKNDYYTGFGFLCGDLGSPSTVLCKECGYLADILCDYPVGDNLTCDRILCEDHSFEIGHNLHYCEAHEKLWQQFVKSGGVEYNLRNILPFKSK